MKATHALAFACLVASVSCGGPTGDGSGGPQSNQEPAASVSEPILNGTTTNARPEIGNWGTGIGNCTATMITTQVGIAAAHCTFGWPVAILGSTFSGQTIDKVWVFDTGSDVTSPTSEFTYDVSIFHLAGPLTSITPATIATRHPASGDPVTLVAYGCTSLTTLTGGGTKRYVQFNYSPTSNAACPGDSGGPLLLGNLADNGPIAAVVSTAAPAYGDAVQFREDIAAVMRLWDTQAGGPGVEGGVDRPGFDQPGMPISAATPALCKSSCISNNTCQAFTWSGGSCWLKSAAPAWTQNAGCVSGLVPRGPAESGTDRPGGDFFSNASPGLTACQTECLADARCRAFTYYNGTCFLKAYAAAPSALAGAQSAVRVPVLYGTGIDPSTSPSNFIKEIDPTWTDSNGVSHDYSLPETCAAYCGQTSGCSYWSFRRPMTAEKGHCSLFNNNAAKVNFVNDQLRASDGSPIVNMGDKWF